MFEQLWEGSPAVTAIENSIYYQRAQLEESFFSPSASNATNCNDASIDMLMLTHQGNDETDKENDSEGLLLRANDITNKRERANEFLKKQTRKKVSNHLGSDAEYRKRRYTFKEKSTYSI